MAEIEILTRPKYAEPPSAMSYGGPASTQSDLTDTELRRNPQRVLRALGLPPHTPAELVAEALTSIRGLVGQGVQVQQEAIQETPLFSWLSEHAAARFHPSNLVITLRMMHPD